LRDNSRPFDAVIIGAGFYGCVLADYLIKRFPKWTVAVVERELGPLERASSNNQARIHAGFHYPRSIKTSMSSHRNYERFQKSWPSSVFSDFRHIYGIPNSGSKISSSQFVSTMKSVGAPLKPLVDPEVVKLFDKGRVASLYEVTENAFNYVELKNWALEVLANPRINCFFGETVSRVEDSKKENTRIVHLVSGANQLKSNFVFNVTYGAIESIEGLSKDLSGILKYQVSEMVLIQETSELRGLAITLMDGPFFSIMPFPSIPETLSFSHVSYTPLRIFPDGKSALPSYLRMSHLGDSDNFYRMKKSASLYVPVIDYVKKTGAIQEIKTFLVNSEDNDSRPILFARHSIQNCYSILGGKLDNVFDMLERLEKGKIF